MKELSFRAKAYVLGIYITGTLIMAWHLILGEYKNPWMLIVLCSSASLALIFKVEGATNRSHYTFSFIIYSFTFALYGGSATILVIMISYLVEWLWNRPSWFVQLFNSTCCILLIQVAGFIYRFINPEYTLTSWQAVIALAASLSIFSL